MRTFFRRIQWKLTLSYVVVTAGTVTVLAALIVAIVILTEKRASDQLYSSFYWSKTAFQDNVPFLMDDPKGLQKWLERVQESGFVWNDFQSYITRESLDYARTMVEGTAPVFVLTPDLKLAAAAPLEHPEELGKPFDSRKLAGTGLESILAAAQVGDKNYYAQTFTRPDGSIIAAFPMRKSDDDPVNAIVVYTLQPLRFVAPTNLDIYATFFIVVSVLMFVAALPMGAVFGWLVSRGLRQRLANLSSAASAWSQGDFSASPRDSSEDEIGQLTRDLNSMAEQLRTLLHTRDELARVEERNRLARDLHDTVKQQTYAARMQLSAAKNLLESDPKTAGEHLDSALMLNRETQQELKLLIDELRPAALDGKGLSQAVQEYADRWKTHTGIPVTLTVSGDRPLPLDVEQVLYRVLQEALSNVARHAEADAVELSLEMSPDQVRMAVTDDGRGFLPEGVSAGSLGLIGMKQRLAEINGTLTVDSVLAVGTKIFAEVKLV